MSPGYGPNGSPMRLREPRSHRLTALSAAPTAKRRPSGENESIRMLPAAAWIGGLGWAPRRAAGGRTLPAPPAAPPTLPVGGAGGPPTNAAGRGGENVPAP